MSKKFLFCLILWNAAFFACAEELFFPHEKREPSWKVEGHPQRIRGAEHLRQKNVVRQGQAAEQIRVQATQNGAVLTLVHPIPGAQVIEDLHAQVAFQSNRAAATVCFRLRLPHQQDPVSGKSLTIMVPGDTSSEINLWQTLQCRLDPKRTERAFQLTRARLRLPQLNTQGMYVDAVVCKSQLPSGMTTFWLDELKVQGHIPVRQVEPEGRAEVPDRTHKDFPVRLELDRLYVDDTPRFPLIVPYHGESIDFLSQLGVNTVWIPNAFDHKLSQQLRTANLWPMATPPRPVNQKGEPLDARQVSLAPFNDDSESIMFWYLGTNIPESSSSELVSWQTQVSDADRKFHRPILADVGGQEEFFSHYLDMIGSSREIAFTGFSYRDYRDLLISKQRRSPGTFFWTWIDLDLGESTDPGHGRQPFLEPEQLRLQVYAALSAGCRGLGYYTRQSLDAEHLGNTEIRLMMAELNREIQMLEPLLATGTLIGTVPVEVGVHEPGRDLSSSRQVSAGRQQLRPEPLVRQHSASEAELREHHLEAAMIRSDAGLLLLPVWYGAQAGYVPGQMAASHATIVVPGVSESAAAFLITPTGVSNLTRQRDTGGMKIELSTELTAFSETAAILVTSDFELVKQLQAKTRQLARGSAMDSVLMAKSKWSRVQQVDAELRQLGHSQDAASEILEKSQQLIQKGEQEIERGEFSAARGSGRIAMQLLRILQRQHWEATIEAFPQPATSPYTISFQQLPHHWDLVNRIGRRSEYETLSHLTSGNFEDVQGMIRNGWQHHQHQIEGVRSTAELYPVSPPESEGEYSLRLAAIPEDGASPPDVTCRQTVQVSTPVVQTKRGDIVYGTGWIRVRFPAHDRLDYALISDSSQRKFGQLRFDENHDWQRFEILREVTEDGPFQLSFSLEGLGEMQIDDIQLVTLQPRSMVAPVTTPIEMDDPSFGDRARDLLNRIPGVDRIPVLPGFEVIEDAVPE